MFACYFFTWHPNAGRRLLVLLLVLLLLLPLPPLLPLHPDFIALRSKLLLKLLTEKFKWTLSWIDLIPEVNWPSRRINKPLRLVNWWEQCYRNCFDQIKTKHLEAWRKDLPFLVVVLGNRCLVSFIYFQRVWWWFFGATAIPALKKIFFVYIEKWNDYFIETISFQRQILLIFLYNLLIYENKLCFSLLFFFSSSFKALAETKRINTRNFF